MWNQTRRRIEWSSAALFWGAAAACGKAASQSEVAAKQSVDVAASQACRADVLRPSAVPPEEGVWSFEAAGGGGRVAVMLGPAELRGGSSVVTRSVEAVETGAQSGGLRNRVDTAVVHLDVLPPYGSATSGAAAVEVRSGQSAAVYSITPRVLIAAYESCAGVGAPAIRYLRRDERGRIAVDAMLRRETEGRGE